MALFDFLRAASKPVPPALPPSSVAAEAKYSRSSWIGGLVQDPQDEALLAAYGHEPWQTPVMARRAEAVAQVEWRTYKRVAGKRVSLAGHSTRSHACARAQERSELQESDQADLIKLLSQPMRGWTGFEFWELACVYHDHLGEVLIVIDERAKDRKPTALQMISPLQIAERPTPTRPYFVVRTGDGDKRIPHLDAIWIRRLSPLDPYAGRGVGYGRALRGETATDAALRQGATQRAQQGMPDIALGLIPPLHSQITQAEVDSVSRAFEDKYRKKHHGGVHVFGSDVKVSQLGRTAVEEQYIQAREFHRNTTMQGLGMPPEVLGVLDNANRSTIDAALTHFYLLSIVPILDRFTAALEAAIVKPYWGDDVVLTYTSPVPTDLEFRKEVMSVFPSAFSVDEIRSVAGVDRLPVGGDAFYGASPVTTATADQDTQEQATVATAVADTGVAVQDTALNGAQVSSLLEILSQVALGTLTPAGAKAVIKAAFPGIAEEKIDGMVSGVKAE